MTASQIITLVAALLAPIAFGVFASRFVLATWAEKASKTKTAGVVGMIHALRLPVLLSSILLGLYLELVFVKRAEIPALSEFNWEPLELAMKVVATLTGFFVLYHVAMFAVRHRVGEENTTVILVRKLLSAVLLVVAALTVLNELDVQIGPVLASLGVAGLAVALALQDTLANYFAGITIAIDKPVRPGDYVRLESGLEGFVETIGWRTTRLKPWGETTVVVPNTKLANSILTNNYYPDLSVRVYVDCAVSYESNLDQVESLCVRVAREVAARVDDADTDFEPIVRFKTFGESNIQFTVVLRTLNYADSFLLKHEYIKALHKAFREGGVKIQLPIGRILGEPAPSTITPAIAEASEPH
jgi:small-conductance mechanosensitive channel